MNKDPRVVYADIIDLPRWQSPKRQHMSPYDRAAQFSPFAALTGYEDMIAEEARETGSRVILEEADQSLLNAKISAIAESGHPTITVTYFVADKKKDGGSYVEVTGKVKRVDMPFRKIVLYGKTRDFEIPMDDIIGIHGELVDYLDDGAW